MADEALSPERLVGVEGDGTFLVTSEANPDDWIACFTQDEDFPARAWAECMVELYNLRGHEHEGGPLKAPVFAGTHHPHTR